MNEIANLSERMAAMQKRHAEEVQEKESKIKSLVEQIERLRTCSVRAGVSREAFRSRFQDLSPLEEVQ